MRAPLYLAILGFAASASCEYLMGGHVDNGGTAPSKPPAELLDSTPLEARTVHRDDLDPDFESEETTLGPSSSIDEDESQRYHHPYPFAFNGGRPFSLEKDPITGKIDFGKAPPVKALNYTDRYKVDAAVGRLEESLEKEETRPYANKKLENEDTNEINPYSPNFHDFLNLPVHYSSDKYGRDKYPLISSSYANTKVQSGSNSYSTYNHKPYHGETLVYYPTRKTVQTRPTTAGFRPSTTTFVPTTSSSTTMSSSTTTSSTTTTTTTRRPSSSIVVTSGTTEVSTTSTVPSTTITRLALTTLASTKAPVVTTWKPRVPTTKRYPDRTDVDYEDVLPIEKFQASMYTREHGGSNSLPQLPDGGASQTKPSILKDEYVDSYEEYEMNDSEEAKDYVSSIKTANEVSRSTAMVEHVETTPSPQTTATMSASITPSRIESPASQGSLNDPFRVQPQRGPVTSMPLDNEPLASPEQDNRRIIAEGSSIDRYRPNEMVHQRPGGPSILVESTSNIVVPPDQDTVSFVLGNRQNVEGGYYSLGTAIGENPYSGPSGIGYDPQADLRGVALPSVAVVETGPQGWHQAAPMSQHSPNTHKLTNEIEPPRNSFVKGTVLFTDREIDAKEEKDANFVVFPKDDSQHSMEEQEKHQQQRIEPGLPSSTSKPRIEPQIHPVEKVDNLPQLSENLTPPAERPRPPPSFYHHYHQAARPDYPRPQRVPQPPRVKQPAPSDPIRRRPYSPDSSLPNILPQFRPNAKTSHGHHRGSETIGTIPAGQSYTATRLRPPRRPLLPPPPASYLQRLNPPPPPIHALRLTGAKSPAAKPPENAIREPDSNLKRFRPQAVPPAVLVASRGDEESKSIETSPKVRLEDEDRSERYSEEPPQLPPRPPLFPKRIHSDRVATLQMIQHHGEQLVEEPGPSSEEATVERTNEQRDEIRRKVDNRENEPPVYVVYPVNTAVNIHPDDSREKDESVVVGTRGPHRPLPPENLLRNENHQENREQDREENDETGDEEPQVHGLFGAAGRPVVSDFPYPLERPDPSVLGMRETPLLVPSDREEGSVKEEEREDEKDASVNVIPYLQDFLPFPPRKNEAISATLHRIPSTQSSTPIAYVYTPTAQAASHRLDLREKEKLLGERNEKPPVLLPSQQPSSSSSSAPSPQNFMAPFVASVSAEAPAKNGWNVVLVESNVERKSDESKSEDSLDTEETRTEKTDFDAENFKPQLFGGFKPIYEFPMEQADRRETTEINSEMPRRLDSEASDKPV